MRSRLPMLLLAASISVHALAADKPDSIRVANARCVEAATNPDVGPDAVIAACREAAEAGVPGAQYAMGLTLLRRSHGKKTLEALQWLERAASSGHPGASYVLAGLVDATDSERAVKLFLFAACGEYTPALDDLREHGIAFDRKACPPRPLTDFSGEWSGRLDWAKVLPVASDGPELKVAFHGGAAHVFVKSDDGWEEVKPGKFTVSQLDETVVVSVLDSGSDFDGKWIETWSLTFLRLTENEAVVSYVRTVNNRDMPATLSWRTFTTIAEGRMKRNATPAAH